MTDAPDFDELVSDSERETTSSSNYTDEEKSEQIFIKGRYGTKMFRRDEGCQLCGRKADAVLLTDVIEGEVRPDYDRAIPVCDDHEGDIRGDLKYGPNLVQRRDF